MGNLNPESGQNTEARKFEREHQSSTFQQPASITTWHDDWLQSYGPIAKRVGQEQSAKGKERGAIAYNRQIASEDPVSVQIR